MIRQKSADAGRLLFVVATFLSLLLAAKLCAQEQDTDDRLTLGLSLEELLNYEVTTPTKSDTRLSDSPGSVSVITYEQIRESAARTIPELLRVVAGVNVRWNPMVQSIEMRGFGSSPFTSRVLLLIDGVPYNSWNKGGFPQHPGFDFFNLNNVKHIEITRGAGSALYGENALSGIINIITLSGDDFRQGRVSVAAGPRDTSSVNYSSGWQIGEDASLFLSLRTEQSQIPTEFWIEQDAKAEGQDLFIKGRYKDLKLSYYRRSDEFDGFDDNVVPPDFNFTSVDHIAQDIDIFAANYHYESDAQNWALQANASLASRDGTHCGGCHAASTSEEFSQSVDHGYQGFGNVQINYKGFEQHDPLIGAELRKISAGDSFGQVESAEEPTTRYRKSALFVQDQISLLDDKLELFAGLRYDSKTSPELLQSRTFPRLAMVGRPNDKLTVRAAWSKAARYPSFVELNQNVTFFSAESESGELPFPATYFLPNPDLVAEMMESTELGFEYRFSRSLQTKLDLYYNEFEDPIVLVYGDGAIGFENHANSARVSGFETELRAEPKRNLSLFLNWSFQQNEQAGTALDSAGRPIEFTYAPENKVNGGVTYQFLNGLSTTLQFSWRDNYQAPAFWNELLLGDENAVQSGYSYVDLKARYRLPFDIGGSNQPVTLNFYAKNLGDEKPAETLTGASGEVQGREFYFSLDYEWAH